MLTISKSSVASACFSPSGLVFFSAPLLTIFLTGDFFWVSVFTTVREEVDWFSREMELKLRENDHKPGWDKMNYGRLMERLDEECKEAEEAIKNFLANLMMEEGAPGAAAEAAIQELADVANFAMMMADRIRKKLDE